MSWTEMRNFSQKRMIQATTWILKTITKKLLAGFELELELELIQSHMAQKPMLRGEVGARALCVRSVSREEAWASAGVQGALVGGCGCEAE